ncbi:Unknown protein sequence [Pseudomonas savastanoi pv. phaseolicola]|nr:Unknown protein sequence [Pseudomonas savastanoi pv. phaseolicola]
MPQIELSEKADSDLEAIHEHYAGLMSKTHQTQIERRFLSWNGSFVTSFRTTSKRSSSKVSPCVCTSMVKVGMESSTQPA